MFAIIFYFKIKVPFIIKSAILPSNKSEIDEFEAWATTIPWMDEPPAYSVFFNFRSRQKNKDKNNLIKELRLTPEEGLEIFKRRTRDDLKGMSKLCAKFIGPAEDKLFSCGAGIKGGSVDAYGNFQACLLLRHPDKVYELKKGSLEDCLTNFFPKIREIKAANSGYLRRCAKCFLKGLCEQCPAKSWMEKGNLDTPIEYLCDIAHLQANYLGLLQKHEKGWEITDWKQRIKILSNQGQDVS